MKTAKKAKIEKLALSKETLQRFTVKSSVQAGRMIGSGGTGWTSIGGSCSPACNASDAVCPTNL